MDYIGIGVFMSVDKKTLGVIMVLLAALLWSSNAPFVRYVTMDSFTVAGIRSLIAAIVLMPFFRPKKINFNGYFFGFLACFILLTFGIILAIRMTSSSIALGMQYTSCIWLFLLAKPSKKDFNLKRIWPLVLIVFGVIISMFSKADRISLEGNIIAISTSFSFAGMTYFAKKLNTDNPIGLASISNLALAVIALAVSFISKPDFTRFLSVDYKEWLVMLYLGVLQIGASYALYYSGLRYVSAGTASMLCPLEMILGPIWTLIFFQEYPDVFGWIGFAVVVIGVLGEAVMSAFYDKYLAKKEQKEEYVCVNGENNGE